MVLGKSIQCLQIQATWISDVLPEVIILPFRNGNKYNFYLIQEWKVAKDWKIAKVTFIFKNGSRGDPDNYGPVILTSILAELVESRIELVGTLLNKSYFKRISMYSIREGLVSLVFFEG